MRFLLYVLVFVFGVAGEVAARDIEVLIESRKGIGLIPSFWRGVVHDGGDIELDVNWVHLEPRLVAAAWKEKIGGGGPGWVALDRAIDSAKSRGARVLLPLPVALAPRNESVWRERIEDTVRRTAERVDRYEILGDPSLGRDRYLALYESGAWAAYQGYHLAMIGGPGEDLSTGTLRALLQRVSERDLPLSFVSWQINAMSGEDAEDAFSRVEGMLDRASLKERPAAVVSRWRAEDGPDVASVTLRTLHGLTKVNLDAAFVDLDATPWGTTALRIFDRLGQVEIPMLFDPDGDLNGVATLDGDDVRILLWANRRSRANLSVSGMRWGRMYAYERSVVGVMQTQVAERRELRAEDPVEISVSVSPGSPVFLTLTPKN